MMKKNINQKIISIIEYYKMINLDMIISNDPITRYKREKNINFVSDKKEKLNILKKKIENIKNCNLKKAANKMVFSDGNINSKIMLVGEGPGAQEDRMGLPFVGAAGKLLTKLLNSINLSRDDVFITNIVKCRPPNNRDPLPSEVEKCEPYLIKQLHLISPKLIVALGRIAACTMLNTKESLKNLRNQIFTYAQIDLLVTYHPAALLRNPNFKKPAWEDFQLIRDKYLR